MKITPFLGIAQLSTFAFDEPQPKYCHMKGPISLSLVAGAVSWTKKILNEKGQCGVLLDP